MDLRRAVIAVVRYEDKVLVGMKRSDSGKFLAGKWHLLGENVEGDEFDSQALLRGVFEEVGLSIKVGKYLGNKKTPTGKSANFYECHAFEDKITIGSDLEDARWIKKEKIKDFLVDLVDLWPKGVREYFEE